MVKYALACGECDAGFEGWFSNSADYDDQAASGLLRCPVCDSDRVGKQVMAPNVVTSRGREARAETIAKAMTKQFVRHLREARRHVVETYDNVGKDFTEQAIAMHKGDAEERPIYGEASPSDVSRLEREGVEFAPLPPELPDPDDPETLN